MSNAILDALRTIIDPSRIHTDHDTVTFFACDALHPQRLVPDAAPRQPICVIRPQDTAEVAAVVRLANTYGTPIMPMGGGSGLMGGAASLVTGLVLDLRELQEMTIRAADRMADVGAGVTMRTLNHAAAAHGLMCGHDPWTVGVATVGGTIATNSLGYLGGKYGAMGDQVLGVEAVLPTGEIVQTRAVEKSSTGPALHRLFIGAEGCFGLVTRATLRLFPLPEARLLQAWEFPDFATGFAAVDEILAVGLRPGLLDYGDYEPTLEHAPPAALMVSYEGRRRVAQAEAEEARRICVQHHGVLLPESEAQHFWNQRHTLGDAYAEARSSKTAWSRRHPTLDYLHVALPPSAVLAYRHQCLDLLAQHNLQAYQTGVWDYAGLFSLVYTGGSHALLADVHRELLMLSQDVNGSMEYCHGVGIRLAPLMRREHGSGLDVMRRLKQCLDPHGICNPGKLALANTDGQVVAAT